MTAPLLETRNLVIRFGGVIAANDVSLTITAGRNLAIIGPNGAGKTTFLNICTGWIKPSSGQVLFEGEDVTPLPPRAIVRKGVARAFQIPQLFTEHTALENLLIAVAARDRLRNPFMDLHRIPERDEMMHLLEMVKCADAAHRPVVELPEGQRKLVDIAVALALRPRLLLMDEPTSGVASSEKHRIMEILVEALAERKVTSVFVEHDMGIVERHAEEVAVWNAGNVQLRGTPREILDHPDVIRDVIGEAV
ncbi:ABC transporter ATP-binding protein [Rhodovulum sp. BSW8]|uniref:Amino acid/amide ABC transporter ATP-binding protein 1 (HAAT family) n=2 Tax=Rhodovulum TaxID=34008 RepID=A0A4R8FK30_9RHOB|nr:MULTISPECIES: ATP-binding cassette domain-containing protein [Rhodovulum]RAP40513.1 ABC transporter ATP-binding protein [Rhodovulum viride]RBO54009.1 ABC transporter ATP-binding protein [Rhodovulum sp. BSW8]TDX24258.1 amino acid/amide ABC transporter ATP-binding protein 1 (HAAT family) [Rhodovulum visakhapatnamense]